MTKKDEQNELTEEQKAELARQQKEAAMVEKDVIQEASVYVPSKFMQKWIAQGLAEDFSISPEEVLKVTAEGLGNKVTYMPKVKS